MNEPSEANYAGTLSPFCYFTYPSGRSKGALVVAGISWGNDVPIESGTSIANVINKRHEELIATATEQATRVERERAAMIAESLQHGGLVINPYDHSAPISIAQKIREGSPS